MIHFLGAPRGDRRRAAALRVHRRGGGLLRHDDPVLVGLLLRRLTDYHLHASHALPFSTCVTFDSKVHIAYDVVMSDIYSSFRRRLLEVLEVRVALQRRAAALVDRPDDQGLAPPAVTRREDA